MVFKILILYHLSTFSDILRNSIHQQQSQETLTASSRENLEANLLDTNMNQDSSAKGMRNIRNSFTPHNIILNLFS